MQAFVQLSTVVLVVLGSSLSWALNDTLGTLSNTFEKCSDEADVYSCLKAKAVKLLDRALALDSLAISDHVTIARDPASPEASASTPRSLGDLDSALVDRLWAYLRTRTLRLTLPKEEVEGRKGNKGSKGGKGGIFLVFGAFAAMLMQLALGKLAAIAGKALLVGKVALLLAGIVGLKSLVSNDHSESQPAQVVYAEPEHHASWGRSIGEGADLAFRGQKPKSNN